MKKVLHGHECYLLSVEEFILSQIPSYTQASELQSQKLFILPACCKLSTSCNNKFLVRLHGRYNILVYLCGNTTQIYYCRAFDPEARIFIIISTDEDLSLRIESSAIINLRGVSTKINK